MAGLEVRDLTVKRGATTVCDAVSLTAPPGEITVVLGANGAGKTTLLDGIAGVLPASSGELLLAGERVEDLPMHRRARLGLAYVEESRTIFSQLTVAQNIAVVDRRTGALERAFALFPALASKRNVRSGLLSGGEQQMLLIARALAGNPRVLLIDELSLGLAPKVVETVLTTVTELAQQGIAILLVEQFADMALAVGTTGYVLRGGKVVHRGTCAELRADRASLLPAHYFGGAE